MEWIGMAQDSDRWKAPVYTAIDLLSQEGLKQTNSVALSPRANYTA
jgi:hypothetical protein